MMDNGIQKNFAEFLQKIPRSVFLVGTRFEVRTETYLN